MAKARTTSKSSSGKSKKQSLPFREKLILNQWILSLFGIDPFSELSRNGNKIKPFHRLADPIRDPRMEGLNTDNLHNFYYNLVNSELFGDEFHSIKKEEILRYERNIVSHTQSLNEKRVRPIVWKYYQWLALLFTEIYLERYFQDREGLLKELNAFVDKFNNHHLGFNSVSPYTLDDLNKVCLQNATGSGKTLLMHAQVLQYRHYAEKYGRDKELSRIILITPNDRLSEQHIAEFSESKISAENYVQNRGSLFSEAQGLNHVDVIEITKLKEKEGPGTIATRSLGDQNLLLVDEGHRGMSGSESGQWYSHRSMLSAKGFTFEYSATFGEAIKASKSTWLEDAYAKSVLFDYSYRWFYEDGFGKDYQILNLPKSFKQVKRLYMTACLLRFFQQLSIYNSKKTQLKPFNIEKPLWVFVGSTVGASKSKDDEIVATDIALIVEFLAEFIQNESGSSVKNLDELLFKKGHTTGLLDSQGNDIFSHSFRFLKNQYSDAKQVFNDILESLFNSRHGGQLLLERVKGDSGEIALRVGTADKHFGLINVGNAKALADHLQSLVLKNNLAIQVTDSQFSEAMFNSVKDSASDVNLLIGSKKFVEGWDCWRVSTMGLMHVGQSEGAQIIQLFGRGVRLKGYSWSLKRSGHTHSVMSKPEFIEDLETLNIFGIEADFMQKFRDYLKEEGLPGNELRQVITIPMTVTYDVDKKLMTLRPKKKKSDGKEYDFKKDGPVPTVGEIPDYLTKNPIVSDWYPRIEAERSKNKGYEAGTKSSTVLGMEQLALLNYDKLYFDLEAYKRQNSWYNLNVTIEGIKSLFTNPDWYVLYIPDNRIYPKDYDGVRLLQEIASELLRCYCEKFYNYRKTEFTEPRLELRELTVDDENLPSGEDYHLVVDGDDKHLIKSISDLKDEIENKKTNLTKINDLEILNFTSHLFRPLFHVKKSGKITVLPVALNESEFEFVCDLKEWAEKNIDFLKKKKTELFLLRNRSRGKGVGFFEAGNFHPDFILWMWQPEKQYVNFVEPHGMVHEGLLGSKVQLHKRIKEIEKRLGDPNVVLNSFIVTPTPSIKIQNHAERADYEKNQVYFMHDDKTGYISKIMDKILISCI